MKVSHVSQSFPRVSCNISEPLDACTVEESFAFRKRLRLVGEDQFITETLEAGVISAKKLCTAFGIRPPPLLEGQPDQKYYPLLGLGITRELSKRVKLPQYNTIEDAVELLKKSTNIIVLTGAGVSLSGYSSMRSRIESSRLAQVLGFRTSDPRILASTLDSSILATE